MSKPLIIEEEEKTPELAHAFESARRNLELNVPFLLDAGADRTVFSARFLQRLQPLRTSEAEQVQTDDHGKCQDEPTSTKYSS